MKKRGLLCILILSVVLIFTGCAKKDSDSGLDGDPSGYTAGSGQTADYEEVAEQDPEAEIVWDKIPMIMVDGKLYYDTGEESTLDGRCGTMDGEIRSTVDGSEIPSENDQSNFGKGFGYQYGAGGTIEVFMNDKWIIFEHREGTGSQVRFGDKMIDADGLSEETLNWLSWYNSLSEEEQLAVSAIPSDLLEDNWPVKTEDADIPAID